MAVTTRFGGAEATAWEIAKARFVEGLPDEEQALFRNASRENLFYSSSAAFKNYEANSNLQAVRKKIQPMVDSIAAYGKAVDVFANMSPMVLGPLWGSLRVVIHIAQEYNKYFDKLIEMFVRIGDVLPRFGGYERLFPSYALLRQSLSKAYLTIIEFCMDAKSVFITARKSAVGWASVKTIWRLFDKRFGNYLSDLRAYQQNIEKEAALCHMTEEKEAREMKKKDQKAQQRQKLLGLLSQFDYRAHLRRLQKLRHQGTGSWLLEVPSLRSWLQSQVSGCFCCFGIPGSGKTILASTIVDSMSPFYTELDSAICYHYCDYANSSTLDISIILGTLIRQLLERIQITPEIAADIDHYYQEGATTPSPEDLMSLLERALRSFKRVMVVLDGLDELTLPVQKEIVELVRRITQPLDIIIKVMVFSRREERLIRSALQKYEFIDISVMLLRKDISRFIENSVDQKLESGELSIKDPNLKEEIVNTLVEGAEDMFLWVKFQLDELCAALTDSDIRETLQNLPKDLAATYARILERYCVSDGGETRIKIMQKVFPWLACAKRRLTIEELNEAYSIDTADLYLHRENIPTDYKRILEACGSLVLFDKDDHTITFAHNTVKQFLTSSASSTNTSEVVGKLQFELDEAEFRVGETCITYLCFSDFETQVIKKELNAVPITLNLVQDSVAQIPFGKTLYDIGSKISASFRFGNAGTAKPFYLPLPKAESLSDELENSYRLLNYTVHNWFRHTSLFTPIKSPSMWAKFSVLTFERQLPFDIRPWISSDQNVLSEEHSLPHAQLFQWAAADRDRAVFLQLWDYASDESSLKAYFDHRPRAGKVLLIQAVGNEHYALAKLLLDRGGVDVELENAQRQAMLWLASERGYIAIVELLLSKGANPNQFNNYQGNTALQVASGTGDIAVVELLLNNGADINEKGYIGKTALQIASNTGHTVVVELLLSKGADVNQRSYNVKTALQVASSRGQTDIVGLLLSNGADVNQDGHNGTALQIASNAGHMEVIELLLNKGADVNQKGYIGRTALQVASSGGHTPVVKLLLSKGANVKHEELIYSPALQVASLAGHIAIVELLLSNGADINQRAKFTGDIALQAASSAGHTAIVELLLIKGADVNGKGRNDNCALQAASSKGHTAIVELLLNNGAYVNQRPSFTRKTALQMALDEGHTAVVQLLLSKGATM